MKTIYIIAALAFIGCDDKVANKYVRHAATVPDSTGEGDTDSTNTDNDQTDVDSPTEGDTDVVNPGDEDVLTCCEQEVLICHTPPGNPDNRHEICVGSRKAANAHLKNHNDTLGECLDE